MNKTRRKKLAELMDQLTEIKDELQCLLDEEDEYRDNVPENLQGSARYEESEEASDTMNSVSEYLDSAIDELEELIEEA